MKWKTKLAISVIGFCLLTLAGSREPIHASDPEESLHNEVRVIKNVPYTGAHDSNRELNLYLPQEPETTKLPLVILIHGGGWSAGDKNDFKGVAEEFVQRGYAAASINYRLSQQAIFPAQIIDCKAAIRWLRAHANEYGIDPARIVVGGHSAGGHLAALVGATSQVRQFDKGTNLDQKSGVQAVIWLAGVGDLVSRTLVPGFESEQDSKSGESMLIGGPVLQTIPLANAASPISYVSRSSPPFILFHGDVDRAVPVSQAIEIYTALLRAGVPAELHILKGADHSGPGYFIPLMFDQIDTFLDKTLKRTSASAQHPALRDGTYRIVPVSAPNLVLEAQVSKTVSGAVVTINTPRRGAVNRLAVNQLWKLQAQGDGYYNIQLSDSSGLSLTVTPGSTTDMTKVILMQDHGKPNQRWQLHREIDGKYLLTPQVALGSALDNFGGARTPNSPVDIFTSSGYDPHLQWRIMPAP